MNPALAWHGDSALKERYLARVRAHAAADEIIHGKYWEDGKGCAVGCTVHSADHLAYERELGIPVALARLEDALFEGMANGDAKAFPERFLLAAKVGADLSRVSWQFLHWLLTEELAGRDDPRVRDVIRQCADVLVPLTRGEPVNVDAASAAWSAVCAVSAVSTARRAAWSAARSAVSAAWSAVSAARRAAWSPASAAESAVCAVSAADSAAWSAAESASCKRMADKLIELMECAPLIAPVIAMGYVA